MSGGMSRPEDENYVFMDGGKYRIKSFAEKKRLLTT